MARKCYALKLGGEVYKLRLTLAGQKQLLEKNPDMPILATVMSAADDPADMEALLTAALNWEGNENTIRDGAELYDRMVDDGYCGAKRFMDVALNIAHNAGLIDDGERRKVSAGVIRQLDRAFDELAGENDTAFDEEGAEGSEGPTMRTLDG